MSQISGDVLVTVCAECLTASCWHGEFMCERSRNAGTTDIPRRELRRLRLEHPSNFSNERLLRVCGQPRRAS